MDVNYYKNYEPIFGEWHLVRLIGEGSYGSVFEIEREDFGTVYKAALKAVTIPKSETELYNVRMESGSDESASLYFRSFVEEMVREFAIMSKLKGHSNIVSYEDHKVYQHADKIGWDILIRMELLTPLNKWLQGQKVTRRDIIMLGIDMCTALELCQKYNIIHRDIKPENIFVSESGDYKLGDFGIARTAEKSTGASTRVGTTNYMAPEILRGERYDSSVDIYSLGIVMYRLLNNNRLPFMPPYPKTITFADREQANAKRMGGSIMPPPANAEGRLAEIVLKACAFNPAERYDSPRVMKDALKAILYTEAERCDVYPEGDTLRPRPEMQKNECVFEKTELVAASDIAPKTAPQPKAADETERLFSGQIPHTAAPSQPAGETSKNKRMVEKTGLVTESNVQQKTGRVFEKTELVAASVAAPQKTEQPKPKAETAAAPKAASAPKQEPAPAPQPERKADANQGSAAPKTAKAAQQTERTVAKRAEQPQSQKQKGTALCWLLILAATTAVAFGAFFATKKLVGVVANSTSTQAAQNTSSSSVEIASIAAEGVAINEENFPHDVFRNYISTNFDTDGNGYLSDDEIERVKKLDVQVNKIGKIISDLTGLEYFTSLEVLSCQGNYLTSLDVSKNTELETLECYSNQLTSLDISQNTALKYLDCRYNALTSLDISQNTALSTLYCDGSQLTSLDLTHNAALTNLHCDSNVTVTR